MARGRPSSSSKAKSTPLKRPLSPFPETLTSPSRQSKRLKSSPLTSSAANATPKKSQFFKHESSTSEPEPEVEDESSGYEDGDGDASAISSPPESESEDESEDYVSSADEDRKAKRKRGGARGGAVKKNKKTATNGVNGAMTAVTNPIIEKGKELWRPGVKSDLAPGEEVFIKLPKARGDGGIKYEEGVIHPNTLAFLGDLKENNEREWLKVHDADYRQSKKDWDAFVEKMTERMTEIDETIPELPAKDLVSIAVQKLYANFPSVKLMQYARRSAYTEIYASAPIQHPTR
ncbi:MAG: hypothetical protein LQ338_003897 [Usnochroma carphineum]|nr:MAG: hypothetical protein LQ338_003897 [Usnochroma carphineum]